MASFLGLRVLLIGMVCSWAYGFNLIPSGLSLKAPATSSQLAPLAPLRSNLALRLPDFGLARGCRRARGVSVATMMAKKKKGKGLTDAQLKMLEQVEQFEAATQTEEAPEAVAVDEKKEAPAPPPAPAAAAGKGKKGKKGKMTDAQLKMLEQVEQFEAVQSGGDNEAPATAAPAPAPAPAAGKGKGKKGKKGKMTDAQLKMLEQVEAFESGSPSSATVDESAGKAEAVSESEPEVIKAEKQPEPEPAAAPGKEGKKGKKGKMTDAQLKMLEQVEAFEAVGEAPSSVEAATNPESETVSEITAETSEFTVDDLFGGDDDLDFLGMEDGGSPKKKAGKKKGKTAKKKQKAAAKAAAAGEDLVEEVVDKAKPSSRVKFETANQPGYISVQMKNIKMTFKNQEVLSDASWVVQTGDRVGLVGANGGGKTTQLRIMYGELEPDSGDIVKSSEDLRISFLRQEFVDDLVLSRTLREELMSVFEEEAEIMKELEAQESALAACGSDTDKMQEVLDRMAELQAKADAKGVTNLDSRVEKVINQMGFSDDDGDALVASFSGGWKMRIGLAKILLTEPNLLLLDEPTNHLDLESIEWMEDFLSNQKIPMVIVSHDREFLDQVCTKIVDCEMGKTQSYDGNYSRFLKLKQARLDAWKSAYDAQMKKYKAEKDWINRFKVGAQAAQASSRQKKLDKWQASEDWVKKPPTPGKKLRFRFPPAPRMGDGYAVCELKGISHGYESKGTLFSDVNSVIDKGQRIAFLGPNGCGKSTLLRLVVGTETPDEGMVELGGGGDNLVVNYFEQNQADALDLSKSVLQIMQEAADGQYEYEELRALLGQFLFKGDTVQKKLEMLSGGEKARVALCRMMLRPANLLVLDEPTNHLDIPAKETLEEALQYYDGTMLVISHDRYFISQVANVVMAFEEGKVERYDGDYRYYMERNEAIKRKVEARYVAGTGGIKESKLNDVLKEQAQKAQTKNFGGSAVTSGKKDKGIKNAKRFGD